MAWGSACDSKSRWIDEYMYIYTQKHTNINGGLQNWVPLLGNCPEICGVKTCGIQIGTMPFTPYRINAQCLRLPPAPRDKVCIEMIQYSLQHQSNDRDELPTLSRHDLARHNRARGDLISLITAFFAAKSSLVAPFALPGEGASHPRNSCKWPACALHAIKMRSSVLTRNEPSVGLGLNLKRFDSAPRDQATSA